VSIKGNIADDAMQMDVHKTLYPFYTTKKMLHVTVTITKNALLAAIARYISIMTIYTVGYLQIFNAGHFFSSKHCHHWRTEGGATVPRPPLQILKIKKCKNSIV